MEQNQAGQRARLVFIVLTICSAIIVAVSTAVPWLVKARYATFVVEGGQQRVTGSSSGESISMISHPIGWGIIVCGALCVIFAAMGERWSFAFLIPPLLFALLFSLTGGSLPNAPGAYVCGAASIMGGISASVIRRRASRE